MKKIYIYVFLIILALATLVFCMASWADVYVIHDEKTGDIYTISEKDDTVVQKKMSKTTLPGGLGNYEFADHPTNYKYIDGKFIVNIDKINKAENARKERESKMVLEERIKNKMRELAIKELEKEDSNGGNS